MGFDYDLYVISPVILVGPWLVGGLLGWRLGGSTRGLVAALLLGLLATAVGLGGFVLAAAASSLAGCGETACVELFGRWLEITLVREWPLYTMAAWLGGVATGSYVCERRTNLPETPAERPGRHN
jgi:hypothetical protein